MTNYSNNCVRNLLTIIATFFVFGNAGAQTNVSFDVENGYAEQYSSYLGQNVNVTLTNKTFTAGQWYFIAFPFTADKTAIDEALGEGNYELQSFDSMDGYQLVFKKMKTPAITAKHAYLLKIKSALSGSAVFNNVAFTQNLTSDTGHGMYNCQSTGNNNILLRTTLFKGAIYNFKEQDNSCASYELINGSLVKDNYPGDLGGDFYSGTTAFIFVNDISITPTISIETSSSGDEGGGGDAPDPTTLAGKIALRKQLTDVPTIYIDLPERNGVALNTYLYKNRTLNEAPYRNATIQVVDESEVGSPQHLESFIDTELEIKVRGNSTADAEKKPYRLKFKNKKTSSDGVAHKHDLLGFGYSKRNWVLLANYFDRSLIRNAITYHVGKYVGMDFCPGYKFVDLVIDNEYRGTYQVSDQVEADQDRVALTDEDNDWMIETVSWDSMMEEPCVNSGTYTTASNEQLNIPYKINIKNPDADDLTTDQVAELKDAVAKWAVAWNKSFENGDWADYNDVESLVKFYVGMNITGDWDGFFVMKGWRQPTGVFHWGPLWDKDLAYGNCQYSDDNKLVEYYENGQFRWNFINFLSKNATFVKAAKTLMDKLVNEDNIADKLVSKVTSIAASIDQSQKLNYSPDSPWNLNDQIGSGVFTFTDYSEHINKLKEWIPKRITFVKGEIDKMYNEIYGNKVTLNYNPTVSDNNSEGYVDLWTNYNKIADVTVSPAEAITGASWSTLFLPFNVSEAEMTTVIGQYDLREYSGVSGSTFNFSTPASLDIKANKPYLIKLKNESGATSTSLAFTNVAIDSKTNNSVEFDTDGYKLVCVYHAFGANDDSGQYAFDNSQTGNLTAIPRNTNINGLHFYIKVPSGITPIVSIEEEVVPVVRTQLTDLPTIYIDTKDNAAINPSSGDWTQAGIQVIDGSNTLKPFVYAADDVTAKGKPVFQIRGRGAASWTNAAKKSYRIQFGKDDKDADGNVTTSYKHYLLGDEEAAGVVKKRNWVLLANAGDKTLVRNALTKEIGDIVGLPFTPGYQFVDLVLNGTYVGTYQVTEFIEADANRVNIDEDTGLLIQMTGQADTSTGDHIIAGTDYTKPYLTIKNPEIKTANQEAWNAAFNTDVYNFDAMWSATNGTGLDRETLVNWYIASEITGNYEALSSIYAYLDATTNNLCFGPLWNNETAFDNHASINMTSAGLMNDAETDATHNGLLTQAGKGAAWKTKLEDLWTRKWFAAAVYDRWKVLYNNGSLTTTLKGKVDNLAAIVNNTKSSQALNFSPAADGGAGWTITGQGITSYSKDVTNSTYAEEVSRLKTYLEQRLPYLDKKFKILGEVDGPEITIGTGGYSSFSWDGALDFSGTEVEVYVATSYVKGILQLEKVADGKIPAETGVILKGNEGDKIYPQTISESVSLATTNILLNTASEVFPVPAENSYYALATLNGKTALYKIQSGVTIPLNKAYLSVMSQQAPAAIFFGDIDGTTTGLGMVNTLADGQDGDVYDLQGRRMKGNLAKGIYIKNGKKFIVK